MSKRYKRGTIALLLSPVGLLVISATRLLIISNYNSTTATAIAASGGYVNTLLGSVIPFIPVTLPYLALVLIGFRRFFIAALTISAALFTSPANMTFPKLTLPHSGNIFKHDWHQLVTDHPKQTAFTIVILVLAALLAAWQWDSDARDDVTADIKRIPGLVRPVKRWLPKPPARSTRGKGRQDGRDHNPDVTTIAREHHVSGLAVQRWANGRLWFRGRTLFSTLAIFAVAALCISYVYPFPRSKDYYEAIMRTPWLPAEMILLRSGDRIVGYPLSTANGWMEVLSDASRTIQYVPLGDVQAQVVCNGSDQAELAASSRPVFSLLKSASAGTPPCGSPISTRLQVLRWMTTSLRTSNTSFRIIPQLSNIRVCSTGPIAVTLSVELRRVSASFRIGVNENVSMKPARVRFVPSGLHASSSFTFIGNVPASSDPRAYVLDVEWRSPTGQPSSVERANVSVQYTGPTGRCA
jgi:hypothetical protein